MPPGLQAVHKKVESYFTWVSERKNQGKHLEFLSARKDWIKQHNEGGPDCKRLQSKKALLDAKKTLQVTRKTGGRFLAPKREFIAKDSWDESKHGPLDPSKVVTDDIFGQKVEGCWRLKGKKASMILKNIKMQLSKKRRQFMTQLMLPSQKKLWHASARL